MKSILSGVALLVIGAVACFAGTSVPEVRSADRLAGLIREYAGKTQDQRAISEIDRCAGQYDAIRSRLFWHTNLEDALAEARSTGKLVLSLRLLGRLDEQYSCANSRFFRAILYPDARINALLREKFVLHWESVCKVPIATIDFGDGRVIKRTITGNSIHYVIRADGTVIDALPGLIAPRVFEQELRLVAENSKLRTDNSIALQADHLEAMQRITTEYQSPREELFALPPETQVYLASMTSARAKPTVASARNAGVRAVSKLRIESKVLNQIRNPLPALKEDTLKNMRELRISALQMLQTDPNIEVKRLNDEVYAKIFLMPLNDPWLGLESPDDFTGLP